MNKLTKVGFTALAGSLATIAGVQAGEMSVSGGATITWSERQSNATSAAQSVTGNPLGWTNNLTWSGSGEMDNGISYTLTAYQSDAQALTSSNISFDLNGMGTMVIDNGAGGMGIDALDDKMPSAWEEAWDTGVDTGIRTVSGIHGSAAISYTTPADMLPGGTQVKLSWTPVADGGGLQSDKGSSGPATSGEAKSGTDINITMAPIDGFSAFIGYSDIGRHRVDDALQGTYGFTYAVGPVSFGYQKSYISYERGVESTTVNYYENDNWGVAFNVNDNLSVSYAEYESEEHLGITGGQTADVESIQLAYNIGGATVKVASTEVSDARYVAGATSEGFTAALSLAF
jgi:outer membrane protein OmpU